MISGAGISGTGFAQTPSIFSGNRIMAKVLPFRGVVYNPDKVSNSSEVVTPPYDVISPEEQKAFYDRHPYNVVRLDMNMAEEGDTPENNQNTRAADFFTEWLFEETLIRDDEPAFYFTTVEFSMEGKTFIRSGMIALVCLEPFEKGVILPHEKTFSKVMSERYDLIKACHANFSPIFSVYTDKDGISDRLEKAIQNRKPDIQVEEDNGDRHKMWRVTDPDVLTFVSDHMKSKQIYIADGHHRYETALNYKAWVSQNDLGFNDEHPANYVMMYLCSMDDPGLVVLPAHRMLINVEEKALSGLMEKVESYFDVNTIAYTPEERSQAREKLQRLLASNRDNNAIGIFSKNSDKCHLITLKPGAMDHISGEDIPASLKQLDVTVLTRLVLMEILGFDQTMLDDQHLIAYTSSDQNAIDAVAAGSCDVSFVLNPTLVSQVRAIAEAGQIMPRKTTYFYPKAITGLVLNKLY